MLKSAALLFVVGIALGLWLGFNPQMHAKVVKSWDNTKTFFVKLDANVSTTVTAWLTQAKAQVNVSQKKTPAITMPKALAPVWRQIVSAWDNMLVSLQGIWHQAIASLNQKK
jgi:hypothetical protein